MKVADVLGIIHKQPLVSCMSQVVGKKIKLCFSSPLPKIPGVYVVYARNRETPFYVGETANLRDRLTFLFRCNGGGNPHPFHTCHQKIYQIMPEVTEFCNQYAVRWFSTEGLVGRLEIEEMLQASFGTNIADFYRAQIVS